MVDRIHMLASSFSRRTAVRGLLFALADACCSAASFSQAAAPSHLCSPRASRGCEARLRPLGNLRPPGAGLRSFQDPGTGNSGTERFEIHWYANPPGIPPGVVVLLESIQERNPVVKNHVLRINEKSEGNIRSVIEIPPDEIRRAGRVLKWRVSVVWRGRLLASQTSDNWEG